MRNAHRMQNGATTLRKFERQRLVASLVERKRLGTQLELIEALAAASVMQGGVIGLRVTTARHEPYTIDIYRLGYYHGTGGRRISHLGPFAGAPQPACYTVRATGMVTCPWRTSVRLHVPRWWTSGVYFAVLTTPRSHYQSEIMFTVRDRRPAGIVFMSSVNTYQAYNNYPYDPPKGVQLGRRCAPSHRSQPLRLQQPRHE